MAALLTAGVLAAATAAQAPGGPQGGGPPAHEASGYSMPTNLKVLPKDSTGQQVQTIMEQWATALGTHCDSCHAEDSRNIGPNGRPKLNFADDSKGMKVAARVMYTMTEEINQKYLARIDNSGLPVNCGTCHRSHIGPEPFVFPSEELRPVSQGPALAVENKPLHEYRNTVEDVDYASPLETLLSADGARLYILCQESEEIRVLDAASYAVIKNIAVGRVPRGLSFSPDGARLFVTNSWDDTLSVIDTSKLAVIATWPVGMEPSSVVADRAGTRIFVANRISNDVAVLNAQTGVEEKRLLAGRGSSYLTISPDGNRIYATHVYPNPSPLRTGLENRTAPESEITVIDVARAQVIDRIPLHRIAGVFHVALSADGRLGVVAEYRPKNLVPLAHLEHGGVFEDTITVFGADAGKTVEVPLDELERYASQPFGVAIAPDKSRIYVTSGGSEIVTVVDVPRLMRFIHTHPAPFVQDLSASANYVVTRIPVGLNPRGLTLTRDGRRLFVANRLDDTVSVIDTRTNRVASTIRLAGPKSVSALRHGEQTFYSARQSFQGEIGCANCHIDSTFDGLEWNLEPDGFGRNIVDNKLLEGVRNTEPYKWTGTNPNIPTECGPRTEKYFWRSENYDDLTLADLTLYIRSLQPRPNRWRLPGRELTPAQELGKAIFERAVDKFQKPIPEVNRCSYCHSGPKGTNQKTFDVGTHKPTDNVNLLKSAPLTNIALTAPYLHDGSARTLEEIWTVYNPEDKHGRTNDLTKDELNNLIEYLRTR
ncbi:MAG: c-type cytochrome [Terracidiphilus sp.]|jgi:YVTN family beta-propeller protein